MTPLRDVLRHMKVTQSASHAIYQVQFYGSTRGGKRLLIHLCSPLPLHAPPELGRLSLEDALQPYFTQRVGIRGQRGYFRLVKWEPIP